MKNLSTSHDGSSSLARVSMHERTGAVAVFFLFFAANYFTATPSRRLCLSEWQPLATGVFGLCARF